MEKKLAMLTAILALSAGLVFAEDMKADMKKDMAAANEVMGEASDEVENAMMENEEMMNSEMMNTEMMNADMGDDMPAEMMNAAK